MPVRQNHLIRHMRLRCSRGWSVLECETPAESAESAEVRKGCQELSSPLRAFAPSAPSAVDWLAPIPVGLI